MIVDVHSHFFPAAAAGDDAPVRAMCTPQGPQLVVAGSRVAVPQALMESQSQFASPYGAQIDARSLLPPPFVLLYELDAEEGRSWSRRLNEAVAASAAEDPARLFGFATVPLQAGGAVAAAELEYAVRSLGMRGVEVLTTIAGVPLDAPATTEFWDAAADLGVPIFVHPHYVGAAERMTQFYLRNVIGNPTETALAGARLIFGDLFAQRPDLRVILAHGGGALPTLIGRLRRAYTVRDEFQGSAILPPDKGMRRLFYDTVVFEQSLLTYLSDLVGSDRFVLGTDFPFDMAEPDPIGFIASAALPASDRNRILHSADRLFSDSVKGLA